MNKKELSQLYYFKKENKEQQRRIQELESLATKCTSTITGMSHGTGFSDNVGRYASELSDLKNLLDLNIKKCLFELNKLYRYIGSVDDTVVRQVMIYRFIHGFSWTRIAFTVGRNNIPEGLRRGLFRYINKYLKKLACFVRFYLLQYYY